MSLRSVPKTTKQVAQLSQREPAAGWVSYRRKWKTGSGRQHLQVKFEFGEKNPK